MWQWYDCPPWAANLRHIPTIAYSGEVDRQKQAADVMVAACDAELVNELALLHIIGPNTAHQLHPDSLAEIERRLAIIAAAPQRPLPRRVRFRTCTLKYNQVHWVTIDSMDEHWRPAEVDARIGPHGELDFSTSNVSGLTVRFPPGSLGDASPLGDIISPIPVTFAELPNPIAIAGEQSAADSGDIVEAAVQILRDDPRLRVLTDGSWECSFVRSGDGWEIVDAPLSGRRKRHNLQGPIDDAFMDSFLFVTPTGDESHPPVSKWVESESSRAIQQWRQQMRGDARVKPASEVTDEDIASHNLILWGDPASNPLIERILPDLPLTWTPGALHVAGVDYDPAKHVPVLIYPNPLNPRRYVVLNSGFTYREYDYLNNARQTPKLPDWSVINLDTPPGPRWPGKVVDAGFFGEDWQVRAKNE
ncbi:MAG: hypothetical protein R3B90_03880 [Planctomycetaceae bacterium]